MEGHLWFKSFKKVYATPASNSLNLKILQIIKLVENKSLQNLHFQCEHSRNQTTTTPVSHI